MYENCGHCLKRCQFAAALGFVLRNNNLWINNFIKSCVIFIISVQFNETWDSTWDSLPEPAWQYQFRFIHRMRLWDSPFASDAFEQLTPTSIRFFLGHSRWYQQQDTACICSTCLLVITPFEAALRCSRVHCRKEGDEDREIASAVMSLSFFVTLIFIL